MRYNFTQFKNKSYYGGQNGSGHYQKLISMIPACTILVEGFLGYSGVIRNLNLLPGVIAGFDMDPEVINLWGIDTPENMRLYNADYTRTEAYKGKKGVFFHYDPPYRNTSSPKKYRFDLKTDAEYERFLYFVTGDMRGETIMISHWQDDLFDQHLLPAGFHHVPFQTMSRRGMIENGVYMNYDPAVVPLLDYSYCGKDFTDRQRIKRKVSRTINNIKSFSPEELGLLKQNLVL